MWGGYSLTQLPVDAVPDITDNQVQVITIPPALAAQEVERLITFPIEITMASTPDMGVRNYIKTYYNHTLPDSCRFEGRPLPVK